MKKILIIIATILMALPMYAQLKTTAKVKAKELGSVRMGIIVVTQTEHTFSMALTTDNRFDDPGVFLLGETKESAFQTLDDLIELLETGESDEDIIVESSPGKNCRLVPESSFGVKTIVFYFDGLAGRQSMSKRELEKVKSIIDKKAQ